MFRARLSKGDFKFSSAHFTLFSTGAEPLHGHNYRVAVEVTAQRLDENGMIADFSAWKSATRALCGELDEKVLLPAHANRVAVEQHGSHLEVRFLDREYRFPVSEVELLPVRNISVEELARHLCERLVQSLGDRSRLSSVCVWVEETDGQGCSYEQELASS